MDGLLLVLYIALGFALANVLTLIVLTLFLGAWVKRTLLRAFDNPEMKARLGEMVAAAMNLGQGQTQTPSQFPDDQELEILGYMAAHNVTREVAIVRLALGRAP